MNALDPWSSSRYDNPNVSPVNKPAASAALIARAVAALEGQGKVVCGVMATADKAAIVLTAEGLAALAAGGLTAQGLTAGAKGESVAPVDLYHELEGWAQDHASH